MSQERLWPRRDRHRFQQTHGPLGRGANNNHLMSQHSTQAKRNHLEYNKSENVGTAVCSSQDNFSEQLPNRMPGSRDPGVKTMSSEEFSINIE